jgi:hypothetical protein
LTPTLTLFLIALTAGPASVTDSGAKGDGLTDDAPAIQRALDASATVAIPASTYLVGKRIELRANQHLTIEAGATLKPTADLVGRAMLHVEGVSDVLIDGPGTIDGDAATNPTSRRFGIQIDSGASRVTIRGLTIRNMPSDGQANQFGDAIYVGRSSTAFPDSPTDVLVDSCRLSGNARCGLGVTSVKRLKVINCDIAGDGNTQCGIDLEPNTTDYPIDGVILANNTIRDNPGGGISMGPYRLGAISVSHVGITGNQLTGNGGTVGRSLTVKMARDVTVTGNQIEQTTPTQAVFISNARRVLAQGNEIRGGSWGVLVSQHTAGLTRAVTLSGNQFLGQSLGGINQDVSGLFGVAFTGNTIGNDSVAAAPTYVGISLMSGGSATSNTLSLERGAAGIRITDKTGSGATVTTNTIRGPVGLAVSVPVGATMHTVSGNMVKP